MNDRYERYKQQQASLENGLVIFFNSQESGSFPLARNFSLDKEKGCGYCFVYWKSHKLGKITKVDLTVAEIYLVKDFVDNKYEFIVNGFFESKLKAVFPGKKPIRTIFLSIADLVTAIIQYYDHTLDFYSDKLFKVEVPENPF